MNKGRSTILFVLACLLIACTDTPPTREAKAPPTPSSSDSERVSLDLEESETVQKMYAKGYFKYGTPLAAPYTFIRPGPNDFVGIAPDLAIEIRKRLGFPGVTVQLQKWTEMPDDLEAGIVHMIIGAPVSRPEFEGLDFIQMGQKGYCLLVKEGDDRFQDLESGLQQDVVLTTAQGTDAEYYLLTNYPALKLQSKKVITAQDVVEEILNGESDAVVVNALITDLVLEKHSLLAARPEDCAENPAWTVPWGISIQPDPVLEQFLVSTVAELMGDNWLEVRKEKWLSSKQLRGVLGLQAKP